MKNWSKLFFLGVLLLNACTSTPTPLSINATEPTSTATTLPIETATTTPSLTLKPTPVGWKHENFLIRITDMTMLSNNEVWAIGDPGIIIHDHLEFSYPKDPDNIIDYPGNGSLNAIDFISEADGWIASSTGEIFHWDGTRWSSVTTPHSTNSINLVDIKFADKNNGWAVGREVDSQGDIPVMWQWNGVQWVDIAPANNLNTSDCLYSISVASPKDVWILGDNYKEGAIVLNWNGSGWRRILASKDMHGRNSISASKDSNVWVVAETGNYGTNAFYWNGVTWQKMEIPFPDLSYLYVKRAPSVLALAPDDVWVGGAGIAHWDGEEWKFIISPDDQVGFIIKIEHTMDDKIWALTSGGDIIRLYDASK